MELTPRMRQLAQARVELAEHLTVDPDELDHELITQSQLYYTVSDLYADAQKYRDKAEEALRRKSAELGTRLKHAASHAGEKLTVKELGDRVSGHDDYAHPHELYVAWGAECDKWKALKDSFAQRSHALHDLAVLYEHDYFSRNSVAARKGSHSKILRRHAQTRRTRAEKKHD